MIFRRLKQSRNKLRKKPNQKKAKNGAKESLRPELPEAMSFKEEKKNNNSKDIPQED